MEIVQALNIEALLSLGVNNDVQPAAASCGSWRTTNNIRDGVLLFQPRLGYRLYVFIGPDCLEEKLFLGSGRSPPVLIDRSVRPAPAWKADKNQTFTADQEIWGVLASKSFDQACPPLLSPTNGKLEITICRS